jgi:hypothetical protein
LGERAGGKKKRRAWCSCGYSLRGYKINSVEEYTVYGQRNSRNGDSRDKKDKLEGWVRGLEGRENGGCGAVSVYTNE